VGKINQRTGRSAAFIDYGEPRISDVSRLRRGFLLRQGFGVTSRRAEGGR
jgi:hypothetical protein